MNFSQQFFFNGIQMPNQERPPQSQQDINYAFNTLLLEIYSNWKSVRKLMIGVYNENKKKVNPLDGEWANFLISNNINILDYDSEDDFLEKHIKSISL